MSSPDGSRVSVLTAPGVGAIAVVRIFGADAPILAERFFRPNRGAALSHTPSDRVRYGTFVDGDQVVDDVLAVIGTGPRGQCVDFCVHGGVRVVERVLLTLERAGASVAASPIEVAQVWPCRSTIEREALEAISRSSTARAVRFIAAQRVGLPHALGRAVEAARRAPDGAARILDDLQRGAAVASRLVRGVTVALVGPPNGGKSTLFNRLMGRSVTIVSPTPGTTRDWVSATIELDGVPVTLIDTAGGRATDDPVEVSAIRTARRIADEADLCVVVFDASACSASPDVGRPDRWAGPGRSIVALNKSDLPAAWAPDALPQTDAASSVSISAETGAGVNALTTCLLSRFGFAGFDDAAACLFTRRQEEVSCAIRAQLGVDPEAAADRIRTDLIGLEFPAAAPP